jgi:N-6 DNA Methylase
VSTIPVLAEAQSFLRATGYDDDAVDANYPVWLGPDRGVALADFVAFGRTAPKDMSTAVISVTRGTIENAVELARVIGVPYMLLAGDTQLDLWVMDPSHPIRWHEAVTTANAPELSEWLQPAVALTAKIGLRQLPLFDIPVNWLAAARSDSANRLAPIIGSALENASLSLPVPKGVNRAQGRKLSHRSAARLVVGALTALVMRDRNSLRALTTEALIGQVTHDHPSTFAWLTESSPEERAVFRELITGLGEGIDYQSLDPTILSQVYEQALVDDDDRRQLGIHYTPPRLALRLLRDLPVEIVEPKDRTVLDPSCGSGTLLIAAHDRLRDLQPSNWAEETRHHDLAVHLHGYDTDPFASEIARLTLLLHAQPAGNGWHIEEVDTRRQPPPEFSPRIIVTNPPWRYHAEGRRIQAADEFLRWSMRALAPGGLLGILLPASWLSADNSSGTRQTLTDQFDVFEVWRLPEGTFATSQVATAALLARRRDDLGGTGARVVREVDRGTLDRFLDGEPPATAYVHPMDAPLSATIPPSRLVNPTRPLGEIADILSGPQPLSGIANRERGTLYLNHIRDVPPYGSVSEAVTWRVAFPQDFQGRRGAKIIDKKKVLASAARSSNSPWRFHVALDLLGVAVRNSVRGIAPHDQDDDDLLHALLTIVGSGFASAFAASFGGDRNISAQVLRTMPIPEDRATLRRLARLGRKATSLAHSPTLLNRHLTAVETVVWDAYGVSEADRELAGSRFAGHPAPEGAARYAESALPEAPRTSPFRRVGAVLDVCDNQLRIWVNGLTPDDGVLIRIPARMPGWLLRPGATFDVTGVETATDLNCGRFTFQPMSWRDIDLDKVEPEPILCT